MKINVGSKNPEKVAAVRETLKECDFISGAEVISVNVSSSVSEQPKSLEETIRGALTRDKCF